MPDNYFLEIRPDACPFETMVSALGVIAEGAVPDDLERARLYRELAEFLIGHAANLES